MGPPGRSAWTPAAGLESLRNPSILRKRAYYYLFAFSHCLCILISSSHPPPRPVKLSFKISVAFSGPIPSKLFWETERFPEIDVYFFLEYNKAHPYSYFVCIFLKRGVQQTCWKAKTKSGSRNQGAKSETTQHTRPRPPMEYSWKKGQLGGTKKYKGGGVGGRFEILAPMTEVSRYQ